jgi:ATP-dependent DNA helicase RecG
MFNKVNLSTQTFDWFSPISSLKGVGDKINERLIKLNIHCVGDLLLHCPYRYEDRTRLTMIRDLSAEQYAVVQGKILQVKLEGRQKKRAILTISDTSGILSLVFFHFHRSLQQHYEIGKIVRCYGQVKVSVKGKQIVHPECELIVENQPMPTFLSAVYPTVAGLSQYWLRKMINNALRDYTKRYENQVDNFATLLTNEIPMLSWLEALNTIHQPLPDANIEQLSQKNHPAYRRLIAEELLSHHISLQKLKATAKARHAKSLHLDENILQDFLSTLSFELTDAQKRVLTEIRNDMSTNTPMLRLVQGDVGSGKTIVAAMAALAAISNKKQVAIMAPTEILAEQHLENFNHWFGPLGYRCELLSSKLKAKRKRSILENITLGLTNIIIGTHALFQDDVQFQELGLVVIDEQHRFGVHQRLSLHAKGTSARNPNVAHQLIMTATPIPRTLAMSHYAHLDISIIDSLPPGRQGITTLTIPQKRQAEIVERMKAVCERGQQAYWVCTLIEESEVLECQAAQTRCEELQASLPYRVGLVHGQMDKDQKESVMKAFYQGDISVLVATTVIEVGVNVPNATLMVIENPERLGLAQLHQLRGRVGRGKVASFCVLLYQALSETAQARLKIMRQTCDGFIIAEADLEIRGPGEVLGVKQTGEISFKVADLIRDKALLQSLPDWSLRLKDLPNAHIERMIQRWGVGCHFGQA